MVFAEPPRKELADRHRIYWRPWLRRDAKELVLEGQCGADSCYRSVHACRVALERRSKIRRSSFPLTLCGKSKTECEKALIDRQRRLAKQLGEPARRRPTIELHLPEPVPRLQIADSPPRVLIGSGKDMRDSEGIEPYLDGPTQTSQGDSSV